MFFEGEKFRPKFWWCSANTSFFVYDPEGDVYTCHFVAEDRKHTIGRYMPKLEFNMKAFKLWKERTVSTIPEYKECNLAFFMEEVLHHGLYKTGSIMQPRCNGVRGIVEYTVPFLFNTMRDKLLRNEV